MGLFSKKEDIPEIPPAPTLPSLPKSQESAKKDLPELPSFPVSSKNNNINQEMVKSAVTDMPSPGEEEVHVEIPEELHITEEPKEESMIPPKPSIEETIIPELPRISSTPFPHKKTLEINSTIPEEPATKQIEPIFVRIDKFQSAQKNFEDIKEKIKEIELTLKKIKDVKSREEIELKGWTEDVEKIKARLTEIDSNIFDRL